MRTRSQRQQDVEKRHFGDAASPSSGVQRDSAAAAEPAQSPVTPDLAALMALMQEQARRQEEQARRLEEQMQRDKEEQAHRQEEQARRLEEHLQRVKEEQARRQEEQARRLEEQLQREKEEQARPSNHGHHPPIDRTSSFPNLEIMTTSDQASETSSSQRASEGRGLGRQITTNSPASPTLPSNRYSAPTKCRHVPAKTPVPANRKTLVKTPENKFSTVSPTTHIDQRSTVARVSTTHPSRPTNQQPPNSNANVSVTKLQSHSMHINASRAPVPPRLTTRVTLGVAPTPVAPTTATNMPAPRTAAPASRPSMWGHETSTMVRVANCDPRTNKNKELRHQVAPHVGLTANPGSPAPPLHGRVRFPCTTIWPIAAK